MVGKNLNKLKSVKKETDIPLEHVRVVTSLAKIGCNLKDILISLECCKTGLEKVRNNVTDVIVEEC